jgi:hypothetical protein
MVLMPNTIGVPPLRAYTKSALLTASTTLLGPAAMLGSAGVVTDVLPEEPTCAIAACSPPPEKALSCVGSGPSVVDTGRVPTPA